MAEDKKIEEATSEVADQEQAIAPVDEADLAGPAKEINDWSNIKPGMMVKVHQKIKEITPKGDERERIQVFAGTVIAKKGKDAKSATITVRKISMGVGVERIFPLRLPTIAKIEEVKQLKANRAKLYFIRTYKKRLVEKKAKGAAGKDKK
jgi:large subunit ribosomal protein L19